jgi:hypothetical protein
VFRGKTSAFGNNPRVNPDPKRLLPMLEQISADAKFVDIAEQRPLLGRTHPAPG